MRCSRHGGLLGSGRRLASGLLAESSSKDLSPSSRQAVQLASVSRTQALALLTLAVSVLVGGFLRFSNIGSREMSADEGASWAAASPSTMREVLLLQPRLN